MPEFDVTGLVSTPDRKEREGKRRGREQQRPAVRCAGAVRLDPTCMHKKLSKMSLRLNRDLEELSVIAQEKRVSSYL